MGSVKQAMLEEEDRNAWQYWRELFSQLGQSGLRQVRETVPERDYNLMCEGEDKDPEDVTEDEKEAYVRQETPIEMAYDFQEAMAKDD